VVRPATRQRRPSASLIALGAVIVLLVVGYLVLRSNRHDGTTSTAPTTSGLSTCGETGLTTITLVYRHPSADTPQPQSRQVATFFPWGCRTKTSGCRHTSAHEAYPDPACTPGAVYDLTGNRDPAKYDWTANQRLICATTANSDNGPSRRHVSAATDKAVWREYGETKPPQSAERVETDHVLQLALGGSNHIANLQPEHARGSYDRDEKDAVEAALSRAVCNTKHDGSYNLPLAQAQSLLRLHWTEAYDHHRQTGKWTF
jgi:hypothetical protein